MINIRRHARVWPGVMRTFWCFLIAGLAAAYFARAIYLSASEIEYYILPLSILTFVLALLGSLASRLTPRLVAAARVTIALAVIALGLELWLLSFSLTYDLLGQPAAAIGAAFFAVGVLPLAVVGAVMKGYIVSVFVLAVLSFLFTLALLGFFRIGLERNRARRALAVKATKVVRPGQGAE